MQTNSRLPSTTFCETHSKHSKHSKHSRPAPPASAETRLVVGDSGPGLSETEARRLLLKSTKPGGSGMGLFLVATAMENHGGRLEIARSPLGGAEFRLIFPLLHKGETAHRA